ncbi:MAG: hypothetical protein CVT69_01620 [Actinobacteria bacterium HGW-Actinobacteria-9]|nr:MAG: hypothetical protein CVT69_01620 [Actinobacteria bacterium HGW-Actinobacteria-9]
MDEHDTANIPDSPTDPLPPVASYAPEYGPTGSAEGVYQAHDTAAPGSYGYVPADSGPTPAPVPVPPEQHEHHSRRGVSVGAAIGIAIVAALIVGSFAGLAAGFAGAWFASNASPLGNMPSSIKVLPSETDEPIVAAAGAALPAVVNIDVTGDESAGGEDGLPQEHPTVPFTGNGSGVAFKSDDNGGTYIITNNHVVQNAAKIIVTDSVQERHEGEVVGTDPDTDIAVVRIDAEIPVIELGDSDDLQVGQLVVAIGSPYGLSQSVSSGVISAIGRSLPDSFADAAGIYPLVDVIQTDAAINPGNSGGPLVDRAGTLVGISSAIYSESGASDGVGFAIPVNNAVNIAEQLIESGSAEHPFLGVVGRDVNATVAEEENLPVDQGALVIEITTGTEAEKAGLKPDDIIVGIDDDTIRSMDDLILQVRRRDIGDTVTLKLYRDGKETELEMKVGVKPKNLELPTEETTPSP